MEMQADQPPHGILVESSVDSKKEMRDFVEGAFVQPLREAIRHAVADSGSSDESLEDLQARLERYAELKKDLAWVAGIEPGKFNKDYRPQVAEALSLLVSESTMPGDGSAESNERKTQARVLFMEACKTVYHRHGSGTAEGILNSTEDWNYFADANEAQSALYGVVKEATPESIDLALERCAELVENFAHDNRVFDEREEGEREFVEQVVRVAYKLELLKDALASKRASDRARQATDQRGRDEQDAARAEAQEALDLLEQIDKM